MRSPLAPPSRSLSWIYVSGRTVGETTNIAITAGPMTIGDIVTAMIGDTGTETAVAM
jgi:hypothetical protein